MVWSKLKQNLESFLCPELVGELNTGLQVIIICLINWEDVI